MSRLIVCLLVVLSAFNAGPVYGAHTELTDLEVLSAVAGGDHGRMMLATLSALSKEDRGYLEPEVERLAKCYTKGGDLNWSNHGEWGDWSGYPNAPRGRWPNRRREWGVSEACGYSPVTRKGMNPGGYHGAPIASARKLMKTLFPRVVELFSKGRHGDAIRVIGVMAHSIQDASTFPEIQAIHRSMDYSYRKIGIPSYEPIQLGGTTEAAADAIADRLEKTIHFTWSVTPDIRDAIQRNDWARDEELRVQCCNEAAKLVADVIHTAIILAGPRPAWEPYPLNTNLIVNGGVEKNAALDEPSPEGWVACWNNPQDRVGVLDWEGRVQRQGGLTYSGSRSLKMMWAPKEGLEWRQTWPAALWVTPGEHYQASAWVKTVDATGETFLALEFYKRYTDVVSVAKSASVDGTREWSQLVIETEVPKGAECVRVILRTLSNENGAAWFDDIRLIRIDPQERKSIGVTAKPPKPEDKVLWLDFNEGEGKYLRDRSVFQAGPNIGICGYSPCDLHVPEGVVGSAIEFDGSDDFVECPASIGIDRQCPENAMSISLWIYVHDHRDAVLACKEQYPSDLKKKGYRIMLSSDGTVRFIIQTDAGPVVATSPGRAPLQRWAKIVAVHTADNRLIVYLDGKPGKEVRSKAAFRPAVFVRGVPSFLYLGADAGLREFFAGRMDEFILFNRALSPEEIMAQSQSATR